MRKALVVVLALMGLPLGLEAQTNLDLVNEVLAARKCSQSELADDLRELECIFTLGEDLSFTITYIEHSNGNSLGTFQVNYQLSNGNFRIGSSDMMGSCVDITATSRIPAYPSSAQFLEALVSAQVLVSPRTGDVYGGSLEEKARCSGDG
tara:strand:- start:823 stop:1272 length:450 start_codon:yes stop_codon:yes gene_type:complete